MSDRNHAVFLSYASQDSEAAKRICDSLRAAGVEVWFDQSELRGGDSWDRKLKKQIKECALFVPVISANTQAREEGYFRREWKLAVDRTHDMAEDKPFLVPVVIDDTRDGEAKVPDKFCEVQWSRLPLDASQGGLAASGGQKALDRFGLRVRGLLGMEHTPAVVADPGPASAAPARVSTELATVDAVPEGTRLPGPIHRARPSFRDIEPAGARGMRRMIAAVVLSLAVGAGISFAWRIWNHAAVPAVLPSRFAEIIPGGLSLNVNQKSIALSPDGRTVVYAGRDQLYRRDLGQIGIQPLPGTDRGVGAYFSPDGKWIGFVVPAGGGIPAVFKKVALAGGPSVPIQFTARGIGAGANWGPNDHIYFTGSGRSATNPGNGIITVSSAGGELASVTKLAANNNSHRQPEVLPGGRSALFTVWTTSIDDAQIAAVSLTTGDWKLLNLGGSSPHYVPTGHIVFARGDSIWAVPFDAGKLAITGPAVPVLGGVRILANGISQFAVADDGTLIYQPGSEASSESRAIWVDRSGNMVGQTGLAAVGLSYLELSPDDKDVAFTAYATTSGGNSNLDVVRFNFANKTMTPIGNSIATDDRPIWSPDGSLIAFGSNRSGNQDIFLRKADGSGADTSLVATPRADYTGDWSRDGKYFLYDAGGVAGNLYFVERSKDGAWERQAHSYIADGPAGQIAGRFSPNGRYVAYVDTTSPNQLYQVRVRDFPEGKRQWIVSDNGGTRLRWSDDGTELFYIEEGTILKVVRVDSEGPDLNPAPPRRVFQYSGLRLGPSDFASYDISHDGQRFLVLQSEGGDKPETIMVVLNWADELKRLAPAAK